MTVQRIALVNAKGGSGKSTIATNLAVFFAAAQRRTVLMDFDPQGSSSCWHGLRAPHLPDIHLIDTTRMQARQTRVFQMAMPAGTERLIIDTPAGINGVLLQTVLNKCDTILVPVVPSPIDIRATAVFLHQLSKEPRVRQGQLRIAVIANRIRADSSSTYAPLKKLLDALHLPLITGLHESSAYLMAAEHGQGIHDPGENTLARERQEWLGLARWLALPEDEQQGKNTLNNVQLQNSDYLRMASSQ